MKRTLPIGKYILGFAILLLANFAFAQVTMNPPFATDADNNVVITYDASQGNAGLLGESTIYAHTGVITDKSTSSTDWKYVIAGWSTNTTKALLTRIGSTNIYTLNLDNIRSFYNVPAGETILKLAFVFRNANGSKTGKTASGGDIFVEIGQGNFQISVTQPVAGKFYSQSTNIAIVAQSSDMADLTLFADGNQIATQSNATLINYNGVAGNLGSGRVELVAKAHFGGSDYFDTSYIIVRQPVVVQDPPAGMMDGVNYIDNSTVLIQLFAPNKNYVYLIGDFTNWEYDPDYQMKRSNDGNRYWLQVDGLQSGVEYGYQFSIDSVQLIVADPYANKVLDPSNDQWINATTYPNLKAYPEGKTTEIVSVFQIGEPEYNWQYSDNFEKPKNDHLIIYELLLRDFVGTHDFTTLKDTIAYLKNLGINCIELMPVNEFEGNESWGYNSSFHFAVDKYYGPRNTFKAFVDECHRNGIAVVMDMVLNHAFGSSPLVRMYFDPNAGQWGQPTPDNPWFNQTDRHPYGVGYDFNHEVQPTKDYVDRVCKYWIEEYKIDGYRFDLSKGFTQKYTTDVGAWSTYDQSRVDIWKRIRGEIVKYAPDAYLILEHLGENNEEVVLANEGFIMWGIMTSNYAEAMMGYNNSKQDLSWGNYKARGYNYPNLVTYAESHDEERITYSGLTYGNSNGSYSAKVLNNSLRRLVTCHAILIPLKGPKMIWMGGEIGYDVSIEDNGRLSNKPYKWQYLSDPNRVRAYNEISKINRLKQHVSFSSDDYSYNVNGTGKIFKVNHDSMNTVIVGNLDVVDLNLTPVFQHDGWWYDYISGDSINVTDVNQTLSIAPGEYKIYTDKKIDANKIQGPDGLENTAHNPLKVFPNPAKDQLFIQLSYTGIQEVQIMAADGKLALRQSFNNGQSQERISLEALVPGFYLVQVSDGEHTYSQRIIIE